MTSLSPSPFLRRVLMADAAVSAGTGALLMLGADRVDGLLGLPSTLLFEAGLSLLPFAALVIYLATRAAPARPFVWAIIAYNAMWAVDSILLLVTGWVAPTALGVAFVIAQAVAVLGFAELEVFGLRRSLPELA
ncbi:MAG TPA: hypothetical protein VGB82_08335 [Alphaproteobacteria bacterium]